MSLAPSSRANVNPYAHVVVRRFDAAMSYGLRGVTDPV